MLKQKLLLLLTLILVMSVFPVAPLFAVIEQTHPNCVYGDIDETHFIFGCRFEDPRRGIAMDESQNCRIFYGELENGIPVDRPCSMQDFSILMYYLEDYYAITY